VIDIIKIYAMHGLIHGRRFCIFCNTECRLIKTENDKLGYCWICPHCFLGSEILDQTPLHSIRLQQFDLVIKLFERGYHPIGGAKMVQDKSGKTC